MTVLPFGAISSPGILTQVLDRIVQSIENSESRSLLTNAYGLTFRANNEEILRQCLSDAKSGFELSGFALQKIRFETHCNLELTLMKPLLEFWV